MILSRAHPVPSPCIALGTSSRGARRASQSFVELDDRVAAGRSGVAVGRNPSRQTAAAIGAHLGRRAEAGDEFRGELSSREGTEVAEAVTPSVSPSEDGDPAGTHVPRPERPEPAPWDENSSAAVPSP